MSSQFLLEERLCEALGLDSGEVTSLTLHFAAGEAPKVTAAFFINKARQELLVPILKDFKLVPKGE